MRAVHRLPGRIYPYYLLAHLYAVSYTHLDVYKRQADAYQQGGKILRISTHEGDVVKTYVLDRPIAGKMCIRDRCVRLHG